MKNSLLFIVFLFPIYLIAQEPSAFGAGDLNNPEPYGLTSSEKIILKNKKIIKSVEKKAYSQESQILSLRERMDGLQTIVEGLMEKSQNNKFELNKIVSFKESDAVTTQENQISTETNLKKLEELIQINEQNILNIKSVMDEFSKLIDTINSNYVSKDEYNTLVKDVNSFKGLVGKELNSINKKSTSFSSSNYSNMNSRDLAKQALMNYNRKHFSKAIPEYEELIRRKHKPALAHYMIAEMWYYRKKYDKAISYFKESVEIYNKASYMPTLLLHSAMAMKYTGDIQNSQVFLQALVMRYPDSKEAISAQKQLDNI